MRANDTCGEIAGMPQVLELYLGSGTTSAHTTRLYENLYLFIRHFVCLLSVSTLSYLREQCWE